jgi:hypothetical protein
MAAERSALRSAPPGGHQDQVRALFDSKAAGWPGKYAPLRLLTFTRPGTFPGQQGDASDNSYR